MISSEISTGLDTSSWAWDGLATLEMCGRVRCDKGKNRVGLGEIDVGGRAKLDVLLAS